MTNTDTFPGWDANGSPVEEAPARCWYCGNDPGPTSPGCCRIYPPGWFDGLTAGGHYADPPLKID